MQNKTSKSNLRLFHQVKDVKSYLENFDRIDFASFIVCPRCRGTHIIRWGAYQRKKAGIPIQRFLCTTCERTFSWLPPFLLPHQHYTLPEIEAGIASYVGGANGLTKAFQAVESLPCCEETLRRWIAAFAMMASELYKIARTTLAKFKPNFKFEKDKRLLAASFPPARLKGRNDQLNLLYQIFILREYFASLVEPKYFLVWLIFQKRVKNILPTQFANDTDFRMRENGCRAGPKRR